MKAKKRARFWEQFREAWRYLKESRNYVYAIVLVFVCGGIIGSIFSAEFGFLDEVLEKLLLQIEGLGTSGVVLFILQNNLKSAFYGMVFGVLLGIFPVATSFFNGLVLGYVMKLTWVDSGVGEFWRLLPHGIFELPAVFISLALGLRLGMFIFSENRGTEFMERAKNSMIIFVLIVIPLLIVAAIIEGLLISLYQ